MIRELHYCNTNTYLIEGSKGILLFDVGWAGTFPAFCHALGQIGIPVQKITYILISHFHPDHCGIVQQIADQGAVLLLPDLQKDFVHAADPVFAKEKRMDFLPIKEADARCFPIEEGRGILKEIGIDGQILPTPGHSDESISLCLDDGAVFVGDLNPLYESELHKGTQIEVSWSRLLKLEPHTVYYGHAATAHLRENAHADMSDASRPEAAGEADGKNTDAREETVARIIKYIDKGFDERKIRKKTGADPGFIADVMRMYLTHQNISVQGILDRIEIKGR